MGTKPDDLDAIRLVVETLSPFDPKEQQRIIRWACEKLNISLGGSIPVSTSIAATSERQPVNTTPIVQLNVPPMGSPIDIKSFLTNKNPTSDMQFATTIAYYYAFEAPETQRRDTIGSDELQDACRLLGRKRLHDPGQTLRNAVYNGLLDKSGEKGQFKINTVGENLVAVTLPARDSALQAKPSKKKAKKKPSPKRPKKKTNQKK